MPIIIKEYNWSQDLNTIVLRVPIKNVNTIKINNIFTYKTFIKINFPPYYLEIFLWKSISETESKCKILENELKFILKKCIPEIWQHFEINVEKSEIINLKESIIENVQTLEKNEYKMKIENLEKLERKEIHKEVDREAKISEKIDTIKKNAINNELSSYEKSKDEQQMCGKKYEISTSKSIASSSLASAKKVNNEIPEIRKTCNIIIDFTPRQFKTPQRESQECVEHEWLLKQNEARKLIGFCADDLRPEERNPKWLKDKGDEFYKKENYLAAISAYTTGIQLTNNYFELYLNRAATHFHIGNYQRCAEDCTTAYELLTPPVPSNLKARVKCLVRRGAALSKLGFLQQGLNEMMAALTLDPTNKSLKNDIAIIECKLNELNEDK